MLSGIAESHTCFLGQRKVLLVEHVGMYGKRGEERGCAPEAGARILVMQVLFSEWGLMD
jgi:hypothetical protein